MVPKNLRRYHHDAVQPVPNTEQFFSTCFAMNTDTAPDIDDLIDDSIDDMADDDTVDGEASAQPWDPRNIRITTKTFTLRDVFEQISSGDIDLSPDFQREYVWKQRQKTRLIESILLGIPLPAFYFNQDEEARYQVVDGVQRLSSIALFMQDGHALQKQDLEYLHGLNGLKFSTLDQPSIRRFKNAQIVVHVIEPQTPEDVKYDIFNRVNTLGSPLSAQEIRHAMSGARSRDFLHILSELDSFDSSTYRYFFKRSPDNRSQWVRDSDRMKNRELALRFCAFLNFQLDDYRQYAGLDPFLSNFTKRIDQRSPALGKYAFRRYSNRTRKSAVQLNRAVFEAQSIALASYSEDQVQNSWRDVQDSLLSLFDDEDYVRAVTAGTGNSSRVQYRLERTQAALAEVFK
jgi:Protein of unknown function DUF262